VPSAGRIIDGKGWESHHPLMPSDLHQDALAEFQGEFARQLGCEVTAFQRQELTVVERPPEGREPHLVIVAECGLGTVISTKEPKLLPWLEQATAKLPYHFRAFQPAFLEAMAEEAQRLGYEGAKTHGTTLGMVLAEVPSLQEGPSGVLIEELTGEEILALRATDVFDNALLEREEPPEEIARFRTAFGVRDAEGRFVGMAGVWDQYPGIDEIGVDVVREARGQRLARVVTVRAAEWVREQGRWPIYTMGISNLRSMNNGLACGFRPAWALTVVYVPRGTA
jgi:hypothetical protein